MHETIEQQMKQALWGDFRAEDAFPAARPLLAHYTSIATLENIIESNQLWFSNPLLMNDYEELQFGINTGFRLFRDNKAVLDACGSTDNYEKLIRSFQFLYEHYEQNYVFDTYVLCFSEHNPDDYDGSLSMWRGYGADGSGVALVIDTSNIDIVNDSPMVIAKVHYATHAQRIEWLDERIQRVAAIIADNPKSEENLHAIAHHWFERLKMFSLFSKHKGFSDEKEWRIVYVRERDQNKILDDMRGYFVSDKAVEPKLKLELKRIPGVTSDRFSIENITDRLILGPSISTLLSAKSLQRMLEVRGRNSLAEKVRGSSIPFRP